VDRAAGGARAVPPVDLDREEHRRLALRHRLHRVGVAGVALRQIRQLLAELEQELQPVTLAERLEVLDDLRELRWQPVGGVGHGHLR
jgi:hypothetical protein